MVLSTIYYGFSVMAKIVLPNDVGRHIPQMTLALSWIWV